MNPALFCIWMFIFIYYFIILPEQKREKEIVKKIIRRKRSRGETEEMKRFAERLIDKECLIYIFGGQQYQGIIKEVSDTAVLVEFGGSLEAINLDFVMRIREYPTNKKGKKKSIVVD